MPGEFIARQGLISKGNVVVTGSLTTSGSLTTTGTITATTLVVQTITSSISSITGSTNFGTLLANTHNFTGSVSITGSLAVITTGTEFQVTAAGVNFGNVIGDIHNITGSVNVSGSLSGTSATFTGALTTGGVTISNGTQFRVYNTGNGDYGNLTFATATGFTFDKKLTSQAAVVSMMSNEFADAIIAAHNAANVGMEMRYYPNTAQGFIDNTYPITSGQVYGDIYFRQNAAGTMTSRMMIQARSGNIGIGTTSPLSTLVVNGNNAGGRGGEISITNISGTTVGSEAALNFGFGASTYNGDSGNAQIKAVFVSGNEATDIVFSSWNGSAYGEKMRISNAGYVTKPAQPAFRAYYSTNGYWYINNNDTLVFDLTEYNVGSCYNTSNGRFTAPVAGVYQFNFYSIVYGNIQNGAISLRKNGGAPTSGYNIHFSPYYTSTSWSNVVYTTSIYLNAGDYIYLMNSTGVQLTLHGDDWSSFSGYLVG